MRRPRQMPLWSGFGREGGGTSTIFRVFLGDALQGMPYCPLSRYPDKNRIERSGGMMKGSGNSRAFGLGEDGPRSQLGALCWRMHRGQVEVLLITSRDTGRWVIPKGWPMQGKTPPEAAAQEAWEEAGVTGFGGADAIGLYSYDKTRKTKEALPCVVSVYPLRVERLAARFPERAERRRRWFSAERAARLVAEPELRALLAHLAADPSALQATRQAAIP